MASPTRYDVHVNRPLTNVSVAYRNNMYIARQVFPIIPVQFQTDQYWVFEKASWLRNRSGPRAPGTRSPRADYGITTASYVCINDALAKEIPDEVRDNADAPLRPEITATNFVTDALELALEIRVATLVTASGNWASASNPGTQWDTDTSDAWNDINTATDAIRQSIGRHPNTMVISWKAWKALQNHPDFLDRVKYRREGGGIMTSDMAEWFGVSKILLGGAIYDTAAEGATSSISDVWGNMLWVGYVPPAPAIEEPAAGYVFRWKDRVVRRFVMDQERTTVVDAEWWTDEVITASDAGAIMSNVAASG